MSRSLCKKRHALPETCYPVCQVKPRIFAAPRTIRMRHEIHALHRRPPSVSTRSRKSRRSQRYELREHIGTGGMGTVYRALDRELNRTVAVKLLRPELVPDLRNLLRLKRELVLASRVSDEHVVRVHDIGEVDGRPLIAMDWVEGESLAHLLSRVHCLPPSQTCAFAVQICQALRAIHAANIIHRDLKPGNLLIRTDGEILAQRFRSGPISLAPGF